MFKGFTYTQKQTTIKKIIHQYGLNQKVVRISLVGDSVLELYTIQEEKEIVISRMQSNGWNLVNFKPEELPEFTSNKDENAQEQLFSISEKFFWRIFLNQQEILF